ncbi:hypothetical protein K3N28_06245 [Glycomyces sp. TRM65418]|uniref:hypothetical protein n=1 Tax=Glycomyces sp. TRM65418 TaxID=2867006 RepID=UPI001CE6E373|nr:hypothetical protein [Glycomyces sp. TRM65418]MCC3762668.1 hypothetical protein [Glycomyces sp. TRM65418]QZD56704.1 hypothetical protein K3N28_06195 [Glycomyces sp. TRM65418]
MNERDLAIGTLEETQTLSGVLWGARSALRTALNEHKPEAGHSRSLLGTTAHTLLCDRYDRVFSCEKFALPDGTAPTEADRQQLVAELSGFDATTMPQLPPGLVIRDNLNGSPGWRQGNVQFLLASAPDGIDHIRWAERSPTKQRVAESSIGQIPVDGDVPSLFGSNPSILIPSLEVPAFTQVTTFIVAYWLDHDLNDFSLALGRSRMNRGGGSPWVWRVELTSTIIRDMDEKTIGDWEPISNDDVRSADAPVRLRPSGADRKAA